MSSYFAPLLVGLAAAGSLLVLIGIVRTTWPMVARIGKRLGQRQSRSPHSWATSQELVHRPRAPSDAQTELTAPTANADAGVGSPSADRQGWSAAIQEAQEAHKAQAHELLLAAAQQSEGLRRESEVKAERIAEDARRQARELIQEAELAAKRIVHAAGSEAHRARERTGARAFSLGGDTHEALWLPRRCS